jgi:hypothetical protein
MKTNVNLKPSIHSSNLLSEPKPLASLSLLFLMRNRKRFFGTNSPSQLFDKDITSEIINKELVNQQVFITQEELDKLKAILGVKFDLPL